VFVVLLCCVASYFPLFVVVFCCCSLRSVLAAVRLKPGWAVDFAAMHDVPNGVFLPWKSQRAYSTGYAWCSSVLIDRGRFLLDLQLEFLGCFRAGGSTDVFLVKAHGAGNLLKGVSWDLVSPWRIFLWS
jgi:hypothetical protein